MARADLQLAACAGGRRAIPSRELKMIGTVDLCDGVCILPETRATRQVMQAFATDAAARASSAIVECEPTIRNLPCANVAK